jgi:hypothetical protein
LLVRRRCLVRAPLWRIVSAVPVEGTTVKTQID